MENYLSCSRRVRKAGRTVKGALVISRKSVHFGHVVALRTCEILLIDHVLGHLVPGDVFTILVRNCGQRVRLFSSSFQIQLSMRTFPSQRKRLDTRAGSDRWS